MKKEIYKFLLDYGSIEKFGEWAQGLEDKENTTLAEASEAYDEYVNNEIDGLDDDVKIEAIEEVHGSIEAFIKDNPFILDYAMTGNSIEINDNWEDKDYIDQNDYCDDCFEHVDDCICNWCVDCGCDKNDFGCECEEE